LLREKEYKEKKENLKRDSLPFIGDGKNDGEFLFNFNIVILSTPLLGRGATHIFHIYYSFVG